MACKGLSEAISKLGVEVIFVLPKKLPVVAENMRIIFARDDQGDGEDFVKGMLNAYGSSFDRNADSLSVQGGAFSIDAEVEIYSKFARRIAIRENFDVIHAHDWLSIPAAMEAKKASGKPLIVHIHATEFDRTGFGNLNSAIYQVEREGLRQADHIVAVSSWTKNILVNMYGVSSEKVTVVHNGIDLDYAAIESSENELLSAYKKRGFKIVIMVGRITLQKGPDYFIETARRVINFMNNVFFIVVGSGDMERQIIERAAYLGISNKVLFAGFERGDNLKKIFRAADLLVMPSVSEPFGIVPLEAISNDTPVLISKQSGVSEVLRHALKADFWDSDEMANKIVASLSHQSVRETLLAESRKEVGRLDWKNAAGKTVELYHKLVKSLGLQS